MKTDKDYWDREQFYDEVGGELRQRNLSFDTNALFDLIIAHWPTEKSAIAVADGLVATYRDLFTAMPNPTTFYVATLVRYVLVEAEDEEQACERGRTALANLHAEMGLHDPVEILVVRPATADEIEFCRWNEETLAREQMGRRL
jgi:hypothetical protein